MLELLIMDYDQCFEDIMKRDADYIVKDKNGNETGEKRRVYYYQVGSDYYKLIVSESGNPISFYPARPSDSNYDKRHTIQLKRKER